MNDFIISFNSDVIISAAISGRINAIGNISHKNNPDSEGLLNMLEKVIDYDENNIGYISARAEKEAQKNIESALNGVLNIYWKDNGISDEERVEYSDAIAVFNRNVRSKLDKYIFMLNRKSIPKKQLDKYTKKLKQEFNNLQAQYKTGCDYYDRRNGVIRTRGIEIKELKEFKPDIEDGDIEIIAQAILVNGNNVRYLASIDGHMVLSQSRKMLEEKFGLCARQPKDLIHIVRKRYKHILKQSGF